VPGEAALQVDVAELVDGSNLPQDTSHLVSVREERHEVARQGSLMPGGQVETAQDEIAPGGAVNSGGQTKDESAPKADAAAEHSTFDQPADGIFVA